jgi:multiple sugar transport system substrate-binding protein
VNRRAVLRALLGASATALPSCRRDRRERRRDGRTTIVFKHQPLGEANTLRRLLDDFEQLHPDVTVEAEALPNASDIAHQYFLTALEGEASDFDVLVVDVVWIAEFARAGFLLDLSERFPPATMRRDFLPAVAEAVVVQERTFAIPWYVDTGVLYHRTDWAPHAPRTYAELGDMARAARRARPELAGFVWQGRQYEGLVCNAYETIWGHGGDTMAGGRLLLDDDRARAALHHLRSLVASGVSPAAVTSSSEEETRRMFQRGDCVFMRNWPYAFAETERPGSPLRGRVALAPLPTSSGEPGAGALGGYQLAVNAHTPNEVRDRAIALVAHLTSLDSTIALAVAYGRSPARREAYRARELREGAPLIAALEPAFARARARPVTPYYLLLSDILQGEFSAAISGVRTPETALARAQVLVDRLLEAR